MAAPKFVLPFEKRTLLFSLLLLLLAFFFNIYIFDVILLILCVGYYLVYKYPERYSSKYTSYFINIFIVFCSFFIVIVLIEIYLHLVQPAFLDLPSSIRGDLSDYQSRGFLQENALHKDAAVFRILGLGDSFATCDYSEQKNYHNFLEEALKAGGRNIDIVNAGMAATGPGYYWHILNQYGDLWKPDLLLVGFFVGNDFQEMDFSEVELGPYLREPRDPALRWLGYRQFKGFWLYKAAKSNWTIFWQIRQKKAEKQKALVATEGTFSRQDFLRVEKERTWIFEKEKKAKLEGLWQQKAKLLLKFKEWCAQRQIPLVIAIFPDQFQVDGKLRQEIYQTYHVGADAFDLAYPNRLLSGYCREHEIGCIDMLAPFQQHGASQILYKLRDSHWNEAGNRLAAGLIFDYLEQHRLIAKH